jgi:hypothetical protein
MPEISASKDAIFKSEVDALIKELEISRREISEATQRNFSYSRTLFTTLSPLFFTASVFALSKDGVGSLFIIYGSGLIILMMSIYMLTAVSTYSFIAARASYEVRCIRPRLCSLTKSNNILTWDIDKDAPLKTIWLRSQAIASAIAAISIVFMQAGYAIYSIKNCADAHWIQWAFVVTYASIDFISIYYFAAMNRRLSIFSELGGNNGGLL